VAAARAAWCDSQGALNPARLIFIDETLDRHQHDTRLWPQRRRPYGHWKTMTFVAGLRCDGLTAPFVIDGPINGEWFRTYVEKVLAPTLHGHAAPQRSILIRSPAALCSQCHGAQGAAPRALRMRCSG
jgi:cytochrome c553